MHRRSKWIGVLVLLGCLRGCNLVGGFSGGSGLGAFGGSGQRAAGSVAGIPSFGIPLLQSAAPAQPGLFAGSGSNP